MRMTPAVTAVSVTVGLLMLAGCGQDPAPDPQDATATAPAHGIAPSDAAVTIEPLDAIEGAERYTVEGVGIDVPPTMEASQQELSDGSTQVQLREPGGARASVILTVTDEPGAGPATVDAASTLTQTQIAASGAAAELSRGPVVWDQMPYGVAITLELATGEGDEDLKDVIVVTLHDPDGTRIVGISAEARAGELASSDAFAALRTLRFDG